jgi:hypothetical protein
VAKARVRVVSLVKPIRPPGRSRRAVWRSLVEECRQSGLSQVAFCRQRGIPPGTFSCWKHKLAHERGANREARAPGATRPAFLPVRITVPPPARGAEDPAAAGEIEIALSTGPRVRVRGRVDVPWLGQVLDLLAGRRC